MLKVKKSIRAPFFLIFLFLTINANAQITFEPAFPNIDFEFTTEIQSPLDGTDRMFVLEQRGFINVFPRDPNVTEAEVNTFLDITDRVGFVDVFGQELGLLGIAFHPEYTSNGYFYVYYTTESPVPDISVRLVLSRFSVNATNPNLADPDSELILFQFDKNQDTSNHNGGKIAFGPDNYLYISFGDGGGANDPQGNAQNKNNIFGSISRIDVDLDGSNPIETNPILPNGNYEIPSDNPFVGGEGLDEIYAYGLRNTWRFAFDNTSGRLWGADVGQGAFEEINLIEKGGNYGWGRYEARSVVNSELILDEEPTFPVFFYDQLAGDVSITGGYVYRGSEVSSLSPNINSKYIFGDAISGRVWALDYNASTGEASRTLLFQTNGQFVTTFGEDKNGEIYFADYGSNAQLYKLVDGVNEVVGTAVEGVGEWSNIGDGVTNGVVLAVANDFYGNVYHAGTFKQAGDLAVGSIAVWNDRSGWRDLDGGTNGTINALALSPRGKLYAAGAFTEIGGVAANNIAVWNGYSWSALGSGIEGTVAALEVDKRGRVYAGGIFQNINDEAARNIAFWDGRKWASLNDITNQIAGTNNEIRSLAIDTDGTLYVGGNFDEAGGTAANRIATWDGRNWGTLGEGTSGFVEAITVTPKDIFVGGNFAIAGGETVNRIAKWNKRSATWSALGNGVNNNVSALVHSGDYLYAAGAFNVANLNAEDSIIVNNIARWSETKGWQALGESTDVGVDVKINALSGYVKRNLYGLKKTSLTVGGNFSEAGALNVNNTARWTIKER